MDNITILYYLSKKYVFKTKIRHQSSMYSMKKMYIYFDIFWILHLTE